MNNTSDRVHTISLTDDEIHVLNCILRTAIIIAMNDRNLLLKEKAEAMLKTLAERMAAPTNGAELSEQGHHQDQAQPPIDMATVNAAFNRIREALAEVDSAINPTKTICLLEEV